MADTTNKMPAEVFFEYDKDYRIIATNGVSGGTTSRGDIQFDFFVERVGILEVVRNKASEGGRLGDKIERKPEKRIVRKLQIGILMSVEDAELLANFLKDKIGEMKKIKNQVRKW